MLVKLQLSGVERLDLVLSAIKPAALTGGAEQVLVKANDGALKEPEQLNNVLCPGDCWFRVEGATRKVEGKVARDYENPDSPYRLTVSTVLDNGSEEHEPNVRDAGLIASGQRAEHYEIAAYGCARAFADQLGYANIVKILTSTIEEEGKADKTLTTLAEGGINQSAVEGEQEVDELPRNGNKTPRGRGVRASEKPGARRAMARA